VLFFVAERSVGSQLSTTLSYTAHGKMIATFHILCKPSKPSFACIQSFVARSVVPLASSILSHATGDLLLKYKDCVI